MHQMTLGKAPRPYGFMTKFFHYLWDLIKQEVWEIVEKTRQAHGVVRAFNVTLFNLIPNSEGEDTLSKFRLIELCNFIYKIISKVVANRLKPILPILIGPKK